MYGDVEVTYLLGYVRFLQQFLGFVDRQGPRWTVDAGHGSSKAQRGPKDLVHSKDDEWLPQHHAHHAAGAHAEEAASGKESAKAHEHRLTRHQCSSHV